MEKLYKHYFFRRKTKALYLDDAHEMFGAGANLGLLPENIGYCWGMSKMTVENDITHRSEYLKCTFQEFLEFFARIAEMVDKESSRSLAEKIEKLMDHMFDQFLGDAKRKAVVVEIQYISESEEELDEYKYYRGTGMPEGEVSGDGAATL